MAAAAAAAPGLSFELQSPRLIGVRLGPPVAPRCGGVRGVSQSLFLSGRCHQTAIYHLCTTQAVGVASTAAVGVATLFIHPSLHHRWHHQATPPN